MLPTDANAVNFLTEVLDPELWDYSLGMKDKLNKRFNKSHGMLTGKLADTTGMSKNAIPMLAKHGVKAFHIGYNGVGAFRTSTPRSSGSTSRPALSCSR